MCTDSTSSLIHPVSKGVAGKPGAGIKGKNNRSKSPSFLSWLFYPHTPIHWKPIMYQSLVCIPMEFQIWKITVPVKKLLVVLSLRKQLICVWDYSLVTKSKFHAKLKSWGFLDHLINFSSVQHQFLSTGLSLQETQWEFIQWIKDYIQLNHEYGCIKPLPRLL